MSCSTGNIFTSVIPIVANKQLFKCSIIIIFFLLYSCSGEKKKTIKQKPIDKHIYTHDKKGGPMVETRIKLKKEVLDTTIWEWAGYGTNLSDHWPNVEIKFARNNKIETINTNYNFAESGGVLQGSYKIVNDSTIEGEWIFLSDYDPTYKEKLKFKSTLKYRKDAYRYYIYLDISDNISIELKNLIVKEEQDRIIDNTDVTTLGDIPGVIKQNTKLKAKPGINTKTIRYLEAYEPGYDGELICPRGVKLKLIGRSKNDDVTKGKKNNWYYVELERPMLPRYAWVYGGDILIK